MATEQQEPPAELGRIDAVRSDADGVRIDAQAPSSSLATDALVRDEFSILFHACGEHAELEHGSQSLAAALLSSESNAVELALLTYNAELIIEDDKGARQVLWRELIGKHEGLEPAQVRAILLPHQDPDTQQFWRSYPLKRNSDQRIYLAASLRTSKGHIDRARIALGGAYEHSGRLFQTEESVMGKHPKIAQRQMLGALKSDIKRISTRSSRSGKKVRLADGLLIDIFEELGVDLRAPGVAQRVLRWSLGILALGTIALALMMQWGFFETHYDFEKESTDVLMALSEGRAEEIYRDAAYPMREGTLLESFEDMVDRFNKTLGTFEGIQDVGDIEVLDTVGGKATKVEYDLLFSSGLTTGKLSYLEVSPGKWKLLGVRVSIPPMLAGKADALLAEYKRIKAPDVVLRKVSRIMEQIGAGEGDEVWHEAALPFRESKSLEDWRSHLKSNEEALGSFKRVIFVLNSAQNGSKNKAQVHAQIEFEKQRTTGRFKFLKVEGEWLLQYFKVMIPEPLFPAQ